MSTHMAYVKGLGQILIQATFAWPFFIGISQGRLYCQQEIFLGAGMDITVSYDDDLIHAFLNTGKKDCAGMQYKYT